MKARHVRSGLEKGVHRKPVHIKHIPDSAKITMIPETFYSVESDEPDMKSVIGACDTTLFTISPYILHLAGEGPFSGMIITRSLIVLHAVGRLVCPVFICTENINDGGGMPHK